jgi:hypothetical protein
MNLGSFRSRLCPLMRVFDYSAGRAANRGMPGVQSTGETPAPPWSLLC